MKSRMKGKVLIMAEFKKLQAEMIKATAVLKNLQWCVDNQMDNLDVMSSLDVLADYMTKMQQIMDSMEGQVK